MIRTFALFLAVTSIISAAGGSGVGAVPLSRTTVSMWVLGEKIDGKPQPLVLVYFTGPEDWHKRRWESKFSGNSKKDHRITYKLLSPPVALEIEVTTDRKHVLIQNKEYALLENNVFIVKGANDPQTQQIQSLGKFPLPVGSKAPLAITALEEYPEWRHHIE